MRDYASAERRADDVRDALYGDHSAAVRAERAERYAGVVRIERGPAAFRVTFPQLAEHERGSAEAKAAWGRAKVPMADVKAIPGRTFSKLDAAWLVPVSEAAAVDILATEYGATIESIVPDDAAARIAELEAALRRANADWQRACAERDAAIALADEYAEALDRQAVAA